MKAVQYDGFGGIDVLEVREVATPEPGAGQVLVQVRAAGINPGEAAIRAGAMAEAFPSTFPSGQGSDLAGVITGVGAGVADWEAGQEVIGWVDTRSSQAEYAAVPTDQLVAKPATVDFTTGGALKVAGSTAWAVVRSVRLQPGDVVGISAAAGGVGGLACQLAVEAGATVLGIAGQSHHDYLRELGVTPIDHSGGLDAVAEGLRAAAPNGLSAFIDTFGQGYVELALQLGAPPERIDTIIDFDAAGKRGVQTVGGAQASNQDDMGALVARLADGRLKLAIAAQYPLSQVREAFTELEKRHTRGKIVLIP